MESMAAFEVPDIYSNVLLIGRKECGKTSAISSILKGSIGKHTRVHIFGHTVYKDPKWKSICKYLDDMGIKYSTHTSVKDLGDILKQFKVSSPVRRISFEDFPQKKQILFTDAPRGKPLKDKAAENIFIFDDISAELKDPAVATLLKENRHWKCLVIISAHDIDVTDDALRMVDLWLLFKGKYNLRLIYDNSNHDISYDKFKNLYANATDRVCAVYKTNGVTKTVHNFLYMDPSHDDYRSGFYDEL